MGFELSGDQRRIEHLVDFSNTLIEQWEYDGEIVAEKGDRQFTVRGHASWAGHHGECALTSALPFADHLMANGQYGQLTPDDEYSSLAASDGSWRSHRAIPTTSTSGPDGDSISFEIFEVSKGNPEGRISSQGIILGGVALADYPSAFPTGNERQAMSVDGMVTTIFGRHALIRRINSETSAGADVLVAYDGEPLQMNERLALWVVCSFLAGRFGAVCANLGIEKSNEVWRRSYAWAAPVHQPRPPVDWHRWSQPIRDLPNQLPSMLVAARDALSEGIRLDVAISHLFADSRSNLDIEIRDITLALDSLVESNAFAVGKTVLIEPSDYDKLFTLVEGPLREVVTSNGHPESLLSQMLERLKGANDVTHGERRRVFWRRVGFDLKADEKSALDNRHPMSHQGYVLRGAGDEELQNLVDQVALARNLVNRVVLALLGYRGPVWDCKMGRQQEWDYFVERDGGRVK